MSLASAPLVAFVSTTDPDRARAFYGEVLGLTLAEATPFALAFDAGGTSLRVTIVERLTAAPYTVLGWSVAELEIEVDRLAALGVEFMRYEGFDQDERAIWRAPSGARIVWFNDPDGNVLSLSQL